MKKGDMIEGAIEEIRYPNKGIMHLQGAGEDAINWRVEVKNALPGQRVLVRIGKKRNGKAQGQLLEVLSEAPGACAVSCPSYGKCGGCLYLPLPYEDEMRIKTQQVCDLLQASVDDYVSANPSDEPWTQVVNWMEGTAPSPVVYGYRNKMEFTFGDEVKDGPMSLGMHKRGSFYDVVDADQCALVHDDFHTIVRITRDYMTEREIPFYHRMRQEGYLRHLLVRRASHTGEILIDLVTTSQMDPAAEESLLAGWRDALLAADYEGTLAGILHTRNDRAADVVEDQGTDTLYGRSWFEETLLGLRFIVTPFSFFQTNSYGAEVLYDIAREYVRSVLPTGEPPVIYDLYCGTGTISQLVAPVAREVIGVEIVEEAVVAARENAARNGITNCTFHAGDVFEVVPTITTPPDLLILDPPRDGIHPKAMPQLLSYGVDNILYISCKPTSLARDLPAFLAAGYRPVRGRVIDSFCWTTNMETVVLLSKKLQSGQ